MTGLRIGCNVSYDFDDNDRSPPKVADYKPQPHDLEFIVTLIQLAAIYLTNQPGDLFSYQQLFDQAKELSDDDFELEEADFKIVFDNSGKFIKKESGGLFSLK